MFSDLWLRKARRWYEFTCDIKQDMCCKVDFAPIEIVDSDGIGNKTPGKKAHQS